MTDPVFLLNLLLQGLLLGALYGLIAVGLTLIFGIVRVINFAHGEILMVGMYITWVLTRDLGLHPYLAIIPVALLLALMGAGIQRFIIQRLMNADPHIQIFATVGVSAVLLNLMLMMNSANVRSVDQTTLESTWTVASVERVSTTDEGVEETREVRANVVIGRVWIALAAVVVMLALHLFMTRTMLGRAIRATAQNRNAAQLMGIDINLMYVLTFALGCACVGVASSMMVVHYPLTPSLGALFVLTAFVIVVLGGMGSIYGAFLGALLIGLVEMFAGALVGPNWKEVVYFGLFLVILIARPTGLFGFGRGSE